MWYKYLISNLKVCSDHSVEFLSAGFAAKGETPDVVIETFDLKHPSFPKKAVLEGIVAFQAKPGLFFKITGGSSIAIYRDGRITDQDVNLFLLGSAWGVLCHQRGLFPLHCSAASIGKNAFAFVAKSGGGKSTLAASVCAQGLGHVCDDVAIASTDDILGVKVCAMPKGLKLWRETAELLGLKTRALVTSDTRIEKYYVDPPSGPCETLLNLKAIYELEFNKKSAKPKIEKLTGSEPLRSVYRNVYRVEWLGAIGGAGKALSNARVISDLVPVFRFSRPRDLQSLVDSTSKLVKHMHSLDTQAVYEQTVVKR